MINSFVKSFQEHPSLTSFMLIACAGLFGYSISVFAEKSELNSYVEKSEQRFNAVERRIDKLDYDILARTIEKEVFELERIVDRGEAREIDHRRLQVLKSDLQRATMEYEVKIKGSK